MTSGSEKRARSAHLTIRLTPEERSAIEASAERSGLTAGSYAREVLLGAKPPRQVRRPVVEKQLLAKLLGELGKHGGNLNQLVRSLNQGLLVYEDEIQRTLADIRAMRDAVMIALGRDP